MNLLRRLVLNEDCVLDVGANVGAYTIVFSRLVGDAGNVYSFEPIPENYEILESVIKKASLSNVWTFCVALGSMEGRCEMIIPETSGFDGFYMAHLAQPADSGRRKVVEMRTLDALCKIDEMARLTFVKCDVEGGELGVIRGGTELIQTWHLGWLMEVSRHTSGEVFRTFHELGYRAFVYDEKLIETDGYRDKEFSNYFFFHSLSRIWHRLSPLI
jgi:FkbM family methyltransferase